MKLGLKVGDRYTCCLCHWEGVAGPRLKAKGQSDALLLDHLRIQHHRILVSKSEVKRKDGVRHEFVGPGGGSSEQWADGGAGGTKVDYMRG